MAYDDTYADWNSPAYADATKLERLNYHIANVSSSLRPDMSSAPGSVSYATMSSHLEWLYERKKELERSIGSNSCSVVRMRRAW